MFSLFLAEIKFFPWSESKIHSRFDPAQEAQSDVTDITDDEDDEDHYEGY
jgi:hypothetical protein